MVRISLASGRFGLNCNNLGPMQACVRVCFRPCVSLACGSGGRCPRNLEHYPTHVHAAATRGDYGVGPIYCEHL